MDKKKKLFLLITTPFYFNTMLIGQPCFMQQYYDVTLICSDKERLEEIRITEGVKTYCVELKTRITLLKDMKALWKLYQYFREEKPDIVHAHTLKAGLIGMLAACLAKVPHRLYTVAEMPLIETCGMKRRILNYAEKFTFQCACRVYPNSTGLYEFIEKNRFGQKQKLKVIGNGSSNGIDTSYFSPAFYSHEEKEKIKNEIKIPTNAFVFCFIGHLVKNKGINKLVHAFTEINRTYLYARLLLVSLCEGKLNSLLSETKKEIQNNPNIISVGFQSDVRPYLAISDVFVFPSYCKSFPNIVMQAGAMELPCIVTDINGCNEIIEDSVNGLTIPLKNKEQLKEKMLLLLKNSDLRNRLKQNARRMITSRYEQKMFWEALLEEYKNLENTTI